MTCTRSTKYGRIALWGCFHAGDEADALVASALLASLRARQPEARFMALAPDPAATRERHGIDARALGRGLGGLLGVGRRALADVDVLIAAGPDPLREGDQALVRLRAQARRCGTRLDWLAPAAAQAGIPDPLFARDLACEDSAPRRASRPVVGVNPGQASLPRIADFVAWLLLERYPVKLVASCPSERRLCRELEDRLHAEGVLASGRSLLSGAAPEGGASAPIESLRGCELVVATRFHCILLAALLRIPVLGLWEQPGSRALLESLGQGRFAIPAQGLGTPRLVDGFCFLCADAQGVRDALGARVPERRRALDLHLDRLYGPAVAA